MTYILVALIAALNAGLLFFLSLFSVRGDGGEQDIYWIWLFGSLWILSFTLIAGFYGTRGQRSKAIGIATSTLPIGFALTIIGTLVWSAIGSVRPNSPEFLAACKTSGPIYLTRPAARVESIAYDWLPTSHPPSSNYFEMDKRGNISGRRGGIASFGAPIKFTEGRCCHFEGSPTNGVGPYIRRPSDGNYFGVTELTADVLVTYSVSHADVNGEKKRLEIVNLAVKDRRDGRELATHRYVIDHELQRGCGAVSTGVMSERDFVRRSVATD